MAGTCHPACWMRYVMGLGLTLSVCEQAKWVLRRPTITLATVDKHSPGRSSGKSTCMRLTEAFPETGAIQLQLGGESTHTHAGRSVDLSERANRKGGNWVASHGGIELSWRASSLRQQHTPRRARSSASARNVCDTVAGTSRRSLVRSMPPSARRRGGELGPLTWDVGGQLGMVPFPISSENRVRMTAIGRVRLQCIASLVFN